MERRIEAIIPTYTIVSDHDPNTQKNRIPTEAELIGLKLVTSTQFRLLLHLKDEVSRAQTVHELLLAKYNHQIRELEGTQSQLHESKKMLELMQNQCTVLQAETDRLSGLTHPIRRYPSDVLRCIFEAASDLEVDSEQLRVAINLSHVCQRWRAIALDTPQLWSCIDYTMDNDKSKVLAFWTCFIPRMKAVPPEIVIRGIGPNDGHRLKACQLKRIPVMGSLKFHISTSTGGSGDALQPTENPQLDIGKWLELEGTGSYVVFYTKLPVRVTPSARLDTVTTLEIVDAEEIDVLAILSAFKQLCELRLFNVNIITSETAVMITSTTLNLLIASAGDDDEAWMLLASCPSLAAFHYVASSVSEACLSFVQSHRSLNTLEVSSNESLITRLTVVAPQLRSLRINPSQLHDFCEWQAVGMKNPPFTLLERLTVDTCDDPLLQDQFESLVRSRFLPVSHPESRLRPPLTPVREFSILRTPGPNENGVSEPWRDSMLYSQAGQTILKDTIWDDMEVLSLSWF